MSAIMYELWDIENDEPAGSAWYGSRADAERERVTFDYPEVIEVRPVGAPSPGVCVGETTDARWVGGDPPRPEE